MHVNKKARKAVADCYICSEVKPLDQFIALHRNRYRVCKTCKSHINRLTRFGITPDDYAELLRKQDFKCAICDDPLVLEDNKSVIDHCHTTNEIRGVLCRACNTGLANFRDKNANLAQAAKYLIAPPARGVVNVVDVKGKYSYMRDYMKAKQCSTSSDS
jgi:Zn finger protein HypA/HybF involved in hydrogenase expression